MKRLVKSVAQSLIAACVIFAPVITMADTQFAADSPIQEKQFYAEQYVNFFEQASGCGDTVALVSVNEEITFSKSESEVAERGRYASIY